MPKAYSMTGLDCDGQTLSADESQMQQTALADRAQLAVAHQNRHEIMTAQGLVGN